jgi:hypothetical protein
MKFKCTHATNHTDYDGVEIVLNSKEIEDATKVMHSILQSLPESVRRVAFGSNADILDNEVYKCNDLSTLNMWRDGDIYIECDLDGITYEAHAGVWK